MNLNVVKQQGSISAALHWLLLKAANHVAAALDHETWHCSCSIHTDKGNLVVVLGKVTLLDVLQCLGTNGTCKGLAVSCSTAGEEELASVRVLYDVNATALLFHEGIQ